MATNSGTANSTVVDISFNSPESLSWLTSSGSLRHFDFTSTRFRHVLHFPTAEHFVASHEFYTISDHTRPLNLRHASTLDGQTKTVTNASSSTSAATGKITAFTSAATLNESKRELHGFYAIEDGNFTRIHAYNSNALLCLFQKNSSTTVMVSKIFFPTPPSTLTTKSETPRLLVTGEYSGCVHVYQLTSPLNSTVPPTEPKSFSFNVHKRPVSDICVTEAFIFTVGWDGVLCVISNTTHPKVLCKQRILKSPHRLRAVSATLSSFSPSSSSSDYLLAAGGDDMCIHVWSISQSATSLPKEKVAVLEHHSAPVSAISFNLCSLVSGCADGTVRLFKLPTPSLFVTHAFDKLSSSTFSESSNSDLSNDVKLQSIQGFVRRAKSSRRLVYTPSKSRALCCDLCEENFNTIEHIPMCCGNCGQAIACLVCYNSVIKLDREPEESEKCPICRCTLYDVAPDQDFLYQMSVPNHSSKNEEEIELIEISRLSWLEQDENSTISDLPTCQLVTGTFDSQSVVLRIPKSNAVNAIEDARRHLSIINTIRAPHVASQYGIARGSENGPMICIQELPFGGTLQSNMSSMDKNLDEVSYLQICRQLFHAVLSFHEKNIWLGHSLSPSCIGMDSSLVDEWGAQGQRLKLMEFSGASTSNISDYCGESTVMPIDFIKYAAPEVLDSGHGTLKSVDGKRRSPLDDKCDMFTLGTLLWELASGEEPFEGLSPVQIIAKVTELNERPGCIPNWLPHDIQNLIMRLWDRNPQARPSVKEACQLLDTIPSAPSLNTANDGLYSHTQYPRGYSFEEKLPVGKIGQSKKSNISPIDFYNEDNMASIKTLRLIGSAIDQREASDKQRPSLYPEVYDESYLRR